MLNDVRKYLGIGGHVELTDEFKKCIEKFETTSNHYFLTGNAGTGKSTLINYFRENTKKHIAVLAPTGLAAINVRGQTIHSFFHFPPRMITADVIKRIKRGGRMYKKIDTLVIDEASMIRADVLDGIDLFLRKHGRSPGEPFGGIQIILVGDLFQLPPVVTTGERPQLQQLYRTPYFFSAEVYQKAAFETVKLQHIFRQVDEDFIRLLNNVRVGNISEYTLQPLVARVARDQTVFRSNSAVTLTTVNATAESINQVQLQRLPGSDHTYGAFIEGEFPAKESYLPVSLELRLRVGARVMFVKNAEEWVNGSLGVVEELDGSTVKVRLDEGNRLVAVSREEWEYLKYEYDEKADAVVESPQGKLKQYPLRLAWAITIHKSQGMTFDAVNLDFTRAPFAHGQTYVALSRCRTLEGITLSKVLTERDIIVDERIIDFLKH